MIRPIIHVAVGIVFNSQGNVLIAQRPPGKSHCGLWEFPGGKIEPHETVCQALERELFEEIGIKVVTAHPWLKMEYTYPDRHVFLETWIVRQFSGEPTGREGQLVQWVSLDGLEGFQFLAANSDILAKLRTELN